MPLTLYVTPPQTSSTLVSSQRWGAQTARSTCAAMSRRQLALARRQVLKLAVRGTHGGNERVVVGDLGAVADLLSIDGKRRLKAADARRAEDEDFTPLLHAVREIAAVRARVGA